MSKQARVTQRNIQFKDVVEIRQIPRTDEGGYEGDEQSSWNPNLKDTGVFDKKPKQQRKVVCAIVIGGAVLLAIIIGVVLGVVLSQKSATAADNTLSYNTACNPGGSQCMSSQNLYCPSGFCVCTSSLTWNSAASSCTFLKYNDTCSSSSQCDASLKLTCTNSHCQCNVYYTYNSSNSICALILNNTLSYGATCAVGSGQCNSALGLTCTGNCSCTVTKVWNGSACACSSTAFLNGSSLCEPLHKYNDTCTLGSVYCDSSRGLSCNNSRCVCSPVNYWDFNFEQCYVRKNYSESCSHDADCVPTLICPTVPGTCNCSRFLPDYSCDCPTTKYYDSSISQCVNRASLGGACTVSQSYTCLQSLACPSGTCVCPSGTNWNASTTVCA